MRALLLILSTLLVTPAHGMNIQQTFEPFGGTPGKVKLVITPGENVELGKLDLLIVVDDSGSMDQHQRVLSANVPALAAKLANFTSLNVGITTSDFGVKKGKFVGNPPVLNNTMPKFKEELAARMKVGIQGSATEMFFSPIITALSEPLLSTYHAGFLRPEAHLGVVIVTDTDDQSGNVTPEQFVMHLAKLKGKNFSLINFIADPADKNCISQLPGKMPERLALARYMTNGSQYNICGGKFAEGISDVANNVLREMNHKIALPMKPDVATITVAYGALTLPPNDGLNGWTYDEPNNTILLGEKVDFNTMPAGDLVITFVVK